MAAEHPVPHYFVSDPSLPEKRRRIGVELRGRHVDVVTADGENLGNPEAVIDENGQQYLLLSSGGFLDIGDKIVPVPMANVSVVEDQLVLGQMTEEDVERARDFEYNEEAALGDDRPVMLSN